MSAFAKTFYDDNIIEVQILTGPTDTGLCKVLYLGTIRGTWVPEFKESQTVLVRNRTQLEPLNDEAKNLLRK